MARGRKDIHKDGVKFGSGQDNTKGGRKKKIYTVLKEKGFSKDDITTAFGELAFYTQKEIDAVIKDKTKPIIVQIVAKAFVEALKEGDWSKVKDIIEHSIGKAKQRQEIDHSSNGKDINIAPIEWLNGKD